MIGTTSFTSRTRTTTASTAMYLAAVMISSWLLLLPTNSIVSFASSMSSSPCTSTNTPCSNDPSVVADVSSSEDAKKLKNTGKPQLSSSQSSRSRLLQQNNKSSSSSSSSAATTTTDARIMSVNYAYYESWANNRSADCNPVSPLDIDVVGGGYTHLAYAFAGIDDHDHLAPWNDDYANEVPLYDRFNALKNIYFEPLHTLIAVGGWTFTNPGTKTQTRFSDICANATRRAIFAQSVVTFLQTHGFDGIDLDWEFPGDPSRGGSATDYVNFPKLVQAIRQALDTAAATSGRPNKYIITMAIPAGADSLARGYNLVECATYVDWFNLIAYDIHGPWDSPKVLGSHTDINAIQTSVKYVFSTGVPSYQVVLGLANYGHTYILANRSCTTVGCPFVRGGPGGCAGETGAMPFFTINANYLQTGLYQSLYWNQNTESMELVVANGTTWISLDTTQTFQIKQDYATQASLRGIMWWAVDQLPPSTMTTMTQPPLGAAAAAVSTLSPTASPAGESITGTPFYVSFLTVAPASPVVPAPSSSIKTTNASSPSTPSTAAMSPSRIPLPTAPTPSVVPTLSTRSNQSKAPVGGPPQQFHAASVQNQVSSASRRVGSLVGITTAMTSTATTLLIVCGSLFWALH